MFRMLTATLFLVSLTITFLSPATAELLDSTLPHSISSVDFLSGDEGIMPAKFIGAATYAVTIDVPEGRHSMQPNLVLKYNSIFRDSWVGFGWQLEFGAIERNAKFGVSYGADDFVYRTSDGAYELVKISESEFRLKIEGRFLRFIRETAVDGRPMWKMIDKSGVSYSFGGDTYTRQDNLEDSGQIYRWCLERVEDPNGNFMTASYFKDFANNQIYLEQIDYTGHAQQSAVHSVHFILENRNDLPERYKPKFREQMLYRLKTIDIKSQGYLVKRYDLIYSDSPASGRSLLESVAIVGRDGTSILRTIEYDYTASSNSFVDKGTWGTKTVWDSSEDDYIPADVNGDGRGDIVHGPSTNGTWYLHRSNGSQFIKTVHSIGYDPYHEKPEMTFAADVTGDGSQEIIVGPSLNYPIICLEYGERYDCLNYGPDLDADPINGGQFSVLDYENGALVDKGAWSSEVIDVWEDFEKSVHVADVNGDGRKDIVIGPDFEGDWRLLLSNGSGFDDQGIVLQNAYSQFYLDMDSIRVMDATGDRGEELVIGPDTDGSFYVLEYSTSGLVNHGSWYTGTIGSNIRPEAIRAMDLNGDKLDDLLLTADSHGDWFALISTGHSFEYTGEWASSTYISSFDEPHQNIRTADVNGDGLLDILLGPSPSNGNWYFLQNTGKDLIDQGEVYDDYPGRYVVPIDADADGRLGFVVIGGSSQWGIVTEPTGDKPDLLKEVRNGIGGTTQLSYVPSASFPNARLPFPIPVVSQISRNDGNGHVSVTNYEYSGGYYHHMEKDFRGFAYIKETGSAGDDGERKVAETWYHQGSGTDPAADDPSVTVGHTKSKPYLNQVKDENGSLYSQTVTTYTPTDPATLPYYFSPPQEIEVARCDATGSCAVRSKNVLEYDNYGNQIRKEEWGAPNDTADDRTTIIDFSVNEEDWLVGLLFRETIYQGIGTSNQIAQTIYDYDSGSSDCSSSSSNSTPIKGNISRISRWLDTGDDPQELFGYDTFGNQVCNRDPRQNISSISYDSSHTYPKIVTNAKDHQLTNQYYGIDGESAGNGTYGQLKSISDSNGAQKTYRYDAFGRKTREDLSDGSWATWVYNNFGTVGSQHARLDNSLGLWYELYFDGQGRIVYSRQPGPGDHAGTAVIANSKIYDLRGLLKHESLPYFEGATAHYRSNSFDAVGRVVKIDKPDGSSERACYGFDGSQIQIDANLHKKRQVLDSRGRLVRVDEYTGEFTSCSTAVGTPYATTVYQYDSLDNLTQVENTIGNLTQITYDSLGRKMSMDDPDMGIWNYSYDVSGNLTYQRDAKGQIILFQYDALNRLEKKSYATSLSALDGLNSTEIEHNFGYLAGTDLYLPTMLGSAAELSVEDEVTFAYDDPSRNYSIGRISRMTDASGVTDYHYLDSLSRASRVDRTIDSQTYSIRTQIDAMQRTQAITYPGESQALVYLYDDAGNLSQVGSYATFGEYTALGKTQNVTYQNGVVAEYDYVAENGRLQTSQVGTTTSAYLSRQYNYFENGNIQSITDLLDGDRTQSFGYDELDRLKTANSVIYGALTYNYDQLGNLTHKEGIDFFTDTTNKPHQLVSSSNGRYYDYDANGNMLSDGMRSFTYDAENRPISISFNGAVSEFVYDGTGNRVKKSGPHGNTTYIDKLFEVNGTSTAKYIFAGQKRIAMVNPLDTYYYHQDHLGGTSVVTDGTGNKVEQLFYKPFGELVEDSGTVSLDHKYTGQELDAETDLYFYNARYYNPAIGRFISADTIVPDFDNPQSYNRYSYVLNNPLKYNDPTGHSDDAGDNNGDTEAFGRGAQAEDNPDDVGGIAVDDSIGYDLEDDWTHDFSNEDTWGSSVEDALEDDPFGPDEGWEFVNDRKTNRIKSFFKELKNKLTLTKDDFDLLGLGFIVGGWGFLEQVPSALAMGPAGPAAATALGVTGFAMIGTGFAIMCFVEEDEEATDENGDL